MARNGMWVLVLSSVLSLVVEPAVADPRWWTDDLQLTFGAELKNRPHVASLEGNGGFGIFVAWEEVTASGDTDILMLASFDGCNWCGPVRWADTSDDETRPWIGAGTTHSLEIALQVVYERAGQVWVAGDFSIPFSPNPPAMCAAFAALTTPTPRLLSQRPAALDSHPRIFVVGLWASFSQFHAVWQSDLVGTGSSVHYDHDLNQDGTGWGPDFLDLSAVVGELGTHPTVTGDLMSTSMSAATVAYEASSGEIHVLRSADAGFTWTPTPTVVSGVGACAHPTIDSDTTVFGAGAPAWNGLAWQQSSSPRRVTFDGARFDTPLTRSPDFEPTAVDHPVGDPGAVAQLEASLSVWRGPGYSGAYAFWTDEPPSTTTEVVARAGVLNASSVPARDFDAYPFAAQRVAPPDPTLSPVHPLSNCDWDDGWPAMGASTCSLDARSGGLGAAQVTSRDASGFPLDAFMVTFLDDRTGSPQVYFKMTDRSVDRPSFASTTPPSYACSAPGELSASVAFQLLPECPMASSFALPERMKRYLIYAGTAASGPFPRRVEIENVGLVDPQSATIAGLVPATTYTLALIGEDEARNIAPADFDPNTATNTGLWSQQQMTLMTPGATCLPSVVVTCAIVDESCVDGRPANGVYEPGEELTVELTFTNGGDLAADGFAATVSASNATVPSPSIALPTIAAAGGSETVQVLVRIDDVIVCGSASTIDIDLNAMQTTWGPLTPDVDELTTCDVVTAGPGEACAPCGPSCVASGIVPIRPVYATKTSLTRVDVTLDWTTGADPSAESYNTWQVSGWSNKSDIPNARDGGPWPTVSGCLRTTPTTCIDVDAVPGVGGDLEFYQVRGVCGIEEAPE